MKVKDLLGKMLMCSSIEHVEIYEGCDEVYKLNKKELKAKEYGKFAEKSVNTFSVLDSETFLIFVKL